MWAVLIFRIYEVFPQLCPKCGGQMGLIAFITEGTQIRKILGHIGVDSEPPARQLVTGLNLGFCLDLGFCHNGDSDSRAGLPSIIDAIHSRGLPASTSFNAGVIQAYPRASEAMRDAGWEFIGHGLHQ